MSLIMRVKYKIFAVKMIVLKSLMLKLEKVKQKP